MKKFNTGRCFIADRTKPYQVNHPSYGDLVYDTENCVLAVVLGNSVQENGSIWCVAWDEASELYGTEGRPSVKDLEIRGKIDFKVLVKRMEQFAKEGQAHAMFWLGWWYEGVNHPKSIWYYIASIRADTEAYRWVFNRLYNDTFYGAMTRGVKYPTLTFLTEIMEFVERKIPRGQWLMAVEKAEVAKHRPATRKQYERALADYSTGESTIRAVCARYFVTEQGLTEYQAALPIDLSKVSGHDSQKLN